MKTIAVFLCLFVLVLSCLASTGVADDNALKTAMRLYVPMGCLHDDGFIHPIGTGFPVGKHEIMTASHVKCDDGQALAAVVNRVTVYPEITREDEAGDIKILKVEPKLGNIAVFRDARLGDRVVGYGTAFSWNTLGFATFGFVEQLTKQWIVFQNTMPGMSGSALVVDDGNVVGMTVRGGVYEDTPFAQAVPAAALQAFLKGKN